MEQKTDLINQNKVFGLLAVVTGAILSIPYLAMEFNWVKPDPANPNDMGVYWTLGDFVIMGTLIVGAGSIFVLLARVVPRKYRLIIGVVVLLAFLLTWAHLAVGLVDSWPFAGS